MPVQLSVTLQAHQVKNAIRGFVAGTPRVGENVLHQALDKALKRITTYPPRNTTKMVWVSDKQRRYVMWAIRNNVIKVPYQRTGTYGKAWKIQKIEGGWKLSGRASQDGRDYTKYVGGNAYGLQQARIHEGRWALMRDAVDEATANMIPVIREQVRMVARRHGLNA